MKTIVRHQPSWNRFPLLFNSLLSEWPSGSTFEHASAPAVNVTETDDQFELDVQAPGFNKEQFNVKLEDEQLTISATTEAEHENKVAKVTRREFSRHSFTRTFSVPANTVDTERIEAAYENGILRIKLPKLEAAKAKAPRTIAIA